MLNIKKNALPNVYKINKLSTFYKSHLPAPTIALNIAMVGHKKQPPNTFLGFSKVISRPQSFIIYNHHRISSSVSIAANKVIKTKIKMQRKKDN